MCFVYDDCKIEGCYTYNKTGCNQQAITKEGFSLRLAEMHAGHTK